MTTKMLKVCAGQVKISGAEGWQRAVLLCDGEDVVRATLMDGTPVADEDIDDVEELEHEGCFHMAVS
jgi:hypothetical protein